MTYAEQYIDSVTEQMPQATMRSQIGLELRGLIAERVQRGQPIEEVVKQLGDPAKLAESYLSAVPLVSAPFWPRAAAKIVDVFTAAVGSLSLAAPVFFLGDARYLFIVVCALAFAFLWPAYTAAAEYWVGCTLGKWLFGLCVVRESGARISLGQSLVRQLPVFGQIYLIDVLFALFTEKSQRAFEMASKTRVVTV